MLAYNLIYMALSEIMHMNKQLGKDIKATGHGSKPELRRGVLAKRKEQLAKKVKSPERGHEERHWKRMNAEGDRSANDYR